MNYTELKEKVNARKTRGAWGKAVKEYMLECLDFAEHCGVEDNTPAESIALSELVNHVGGRTIKMGMFHGQSALDIIREASEGGNFLIYTGDIVARLCTENQVKRFTRKDGSFRDPSPRESWLQAQTRALTHAIWEIQAIVAERRV